MDYWIAVDRQKIGPLTLTEVRSRRLAPDTLVWHRGLPTWLPASQLPELAGALATDEVEAEVVEQDVEVIVEQSVSEPEVPQADNTGDNTAVTPPQYRRPTPPPAPQQRQFSYVNPDAVKPRPAEPVPEKPRTYLGWNIAAVFLCCLIPAVIGAVFSSKVNQCYAAGDYKGAQRASERAELCFIISIVAGLVSLPFYLAVM